MSESSSSKMFFHPVFKFVRYLCGLFVLHCKDITIFEAFAYVACNRLRLSVRYFSILNCIQSSSC